MKSLLCYLKIIGLFIGIMLLSSLFIGLFNLIGLSSKIGSIMNVIIMVVLFLVFGIIEGLNASQKGFIAGLKIGLIFLLLIALINLIFFNSSFGISRLLYYLILLFSSVFGGMIGISRKKKE